MVDDEQKARMKAELKKLLRGFGVAALFVVAFVVALVVKRKIKASPIIFYEGIQIIAVMGVLAIALLAALDLLRAGSKRFTTQTVMGIVLGMCASYAFHITLPSLLDRSISMFVLSLLREKPLTPMEAQCNYVQQFVIKSGALDKRIKEQIATGNIDAHDGRWFMTPRGRFMDSSWIGMADAFNVRKDFVEVQPLQRCEGSTDGQPTDIVRSE